jgi:hypothetical protein
VKRISAKRQAYLDELSAIRPALIDRCSGLCEVCLSEYGTQAHHKLRRSQGGTNALSNLLWVSSECHRRIHDRPEWAYLVGFMTRSRGAS